MLHLNAAKCREAKETWESWNSHSDPELLFDFKFSIWKVQVQVETMLVTSAENMMGLK